MAISGQSSLVFSKNAFISGLAVLKMTLASSEDPITPFWRVSSNTFCTVSRTRRILFHFSSNFTSGISEAFAGILDRKILCGKSRPKAVLRSSCQASSAVKDSTGAISCNSVTAISANTVCALRRAGEEAPSVYKRSLEASNINEDKSKIQKSVIARIARRKLNSSYPACTS